MHEKLIAYLNSQLARKLSEEETLLIRDAFKYKKLRRHQFLLQEGEVCRFAAFILKGAMKKYAVDETGKENVLELYLENWWVGDRESFSTGNPTPYFIDAFEETELLVVGKEDFESKLKERSFFPEVMRVLAERQALQLLKRVHATKTLTAEQRLADLEKTYPSFLQRFPQHIIASYLGMSKETFSRIRANAGKK